MISTTVELGPSVSGKSQLHPVVLVLVVNAITICSSLTQARLLFYIIIVVATSG